MYKIYIKYVYKIQFISKTEKILKLFFIRLCTYYFPSKKSIIRLVIYLPFFYSQSYNGTLLSYITPLLSITDNCILSFVGLNVVDQHLYGR